MLGKIFTQNSAYFDEQIDLINKTLDQQVPYGRAEEIVYGIAKPITKVILYTKAFINLFDLRD